MEQMFRLPDPLGVMSPAREEPINRTPVALIIQFAGSGATVTLECEKSKLPHTESAAHVLKPCNPSVKKVV